MNSRKSASILGLLSILLKNFLSFFLTPIMIIVFGRGDFGVYKIVISTTAYFMLLDMGMHNVIVRYIAKYRYDNDFESQKKYMGLIQTFYILISVMILITSVVLYFCIPLIFQNSLTSGEIHLFSKIFIILTANSIVIMLFNVYGGVIKAHEKFIFLKTAELAKITMRGIIVYGLLLYDLGVLSIVIIDLVINFIGGGVNFVYVFYKLNLKPEIKLIKRKDVKNVFSYSSFIFLNMIALQLFWSSDNIILGILTSSTLVAVYSIGTMVNSYFQAFAGVFSEFLLPSAIRMVENNKSREELSREMARIGRYIIIFLGLILVGFAFLGDKFIILWLGKDFELAYTISLIVMIPQIFTYSQYFGASVMWAKSRHKKRSIVMLIVAFLNIVVTIILVKRIGIFGAAIGTSFAYIAGYLVFTTWYYHKHVGLDMVLFTKELFRNIITAYIPILLISALIIIIFVDIKWSTFFLQVVLITFVYCIFMVLIGMNYNEKYIVKKIISKFLRKKV